MSFFRRRLEAFPRIDEYRLAKHVGYWPYYKTVESASMLIPLFTQPFSRHLSTNVWVVPLNTKPLYSRAP